MLDKLVLPFLLLPPPRSASFCPGFLPFHSLASGPESENPSKHPTFLSLFFKINVFCYAISDLSNRELNVEKHTSYFFLNKNLLIQNSYFLNLLILSNYQVSNRIFRVIFYLSKRQTRRWKKESLSSNSSDTNIRIFWFIDKQLHEEGDTKGAGKWSNARCWRSVGGMEGNEDGRMGE